MGLFGRLKIVMVTTIGVGFLGIIFNELGRDLIQRIKEQDGPFSALAGQVETMVPLVLVLLLLGVLAWFLVSSVQEERTVDRRRVR